MSKLWLFGVLCSAALAGCGGGGSALPRTAPTAAAPAAKHAAVTVKVAIPGTGSTSNARLRHVFSVATNTQSIVANVYPTGNHTGTPLATATADIAAGAPDCGTSDAQGDRTCTFSLTAPVAVAVDFVFDTYDAANGTGNVLGVGEDPDQTIAAGTTPTIPVTLNSVLASISLNAIPNALHSLIPTTMTLDIYALDADSDIIVSSGFYDQYGDPETVTLAESGTSTSPALNGSLVFTAPTTPTAPTTTTLTAPAPNGVQLSYSGNADDTGSPVTFTASVTPTSVTTTSASLAIDYPAFSSGGHLADSNLSATGAIHGGAAFASGESPLLFIYTTQTGNIDYFNVASPGVGVTSGAPASGYFGGAVMEGGSFYFLAQNGMYFVSGDPPTAPATVGCAGPCPPANASGLAYDPGSGNFYYTSGTNLVQYGLGGIQTLNLGVVATGGVAVDQNGNIWVVQTGANASLLEASNNFASPSINTITLYTNSQPFDVATAGNGDIVVSDKEYNDLWIFNSSGSYINNVSLPCCGSQPWYLAKDPAQPNVVWFDYSSDSGQIGIGRLDINTGAVTGETYSGGPYGGQPGALAVDPSGGVMMTYDGESTLVQVQP